MRRGFALLAMLFASTGTLCAQRLEEEPELAPDPLTGRRVVPTDPLLLPQLTPVDEIRRRADEPLPLGGGLWPAQQHALPVVPLVERPAVPLQGWLRPTAESGGTEMPHAVASSYVARAFRRLVDPQRLLGEPETAAVERFLEVQAHDGAWPLRVWLVAPGDRFPAGFPDEARHRAAFGAGEKGVLAILPVGGAEEAELVFPPTVDASTARVALSALLRPGDLPSAVTSPADHVQRHVLALGFALHDFDPAAIPLARGGEGGEVVAEVPATVAARPAPWALVTGLLTALAAGALWVHRMRRRPEPVLLPESSRPTRLGAPHSGGAGAFMSWRE